MLWTEGLVPLLAVMASLPPLTLAWVAGYKTRDPARQLFAGGLSLVTAIIVLVAIGIFVDLARLGADSGIKFLFWNVTFLLAFASLVLLRRFTGLILPGRGLRRLWFWLASGVFYAATLFFSFALNPPLLDFRSSTASILGSAYYLAGLAAPAWRLWRFRSAAPRWFGPLAGQLGLVLVPLGLGAGGWEGARAMGWLPGAQFSAIPVVFLVFFFLVTSELVKRFPVGTGTLDSAEKARRLVLRFPGQKVTAREQEILALLLEGRKNQEIATALGLSAHTVKNHIYNLYQKLGTDNRLELLALADEGLTDPGGP